VYLDFPLVAPGSILTAWVICWQIESDIAGLELDSDPPAGAQPVRLVRTEDLWLHAFRVFGFPSGYDDGVWASGVLRARNVAGWVQIEGVRETGYWVQPGFSGTPVWDEQLNGVAGMTVAADIRHEVKAAFMIPTNLLIEAWPQLAQRSLDANGLEYLREQLAMLKAVQQNASEPQRFQNRIDELQEAISGWDGRVEKQRQRIAVGLKAQQQRLVTQQRDEKRLRVVGRPPLDVADYFKNRSREQVTIGRLLAEPATRLVSVIGRGGMGKTALACKVLQDLERHRWPHTDDDIPLDGIVYLSSRTAGISLERLFLDCAKVLGGKQEERINAIWTNPQLGTEDKVSYLLEALSAGRYVILLDNIEDLLDDRGQLLDEDLRLFFSHNLTTPHGARLLVTSRIALAFRREVMRFDRQVKILEGLSTEDGVALMRELDPNGNYGLRDAPEERLADAVSLAYGVPRALEVIAGILANDPFASLDDILEQFYEQEDMVQALIEENYKRLDRGARQVIEALAVFRRPVPPLSVDFLLEPFSPGLDVPGIIRRLTRTNIVSVDRATKTVTLHPIDQGYAYSQLPEEGTGEVTHTRQGLERRAAEYYVQLRTPPETWKTIDDLEPQLVEFEHRVRAEDYDTAARLIDDIEYHLALWGHYSRLISMRQQSVGNITDRRLEGRNLSNLGRLHHAIGNHTRASHFLKQAILITREINDRRNESIALYRLGYVTRNLGRPEKSIEYFQQALAIARETDDQRTEGEILEEMGVAYRDLGHFDEGVKFLNQALAIAHKFADRKLEANILTNLGFCYLLQGHPSEAMKLLSQALAITREIGYRRFEGWSLEFLGRTYLKLGDTNKATAYLQQAMEVHREIGNRNGERQAHDGLGETCLDMNSYEKAIEHFREALIIDQEIGNRREAERHSNILGSIYLKMQNYQEALSHYRRALTIARETSNKGNEGSYLRDIGVIYMILKQHKQATDYYKQAYTIFESIGEKDLAEQVKSLIAETRVQ